MRATCLLGIVTLLGCLDLEGLEFGPSTGGSGGAGASTNDSGGTAGTTGTAGTGGAMGGAGAQAYTYFDVVMDDEPTAYYRLDEPEGTADVFDSSGAENHAIGAAQTGVIERDRPGIAGNAATTLSDGAYVLLAPNTLAVGVDQQYTVEAWVQVSSGDSASDLLYVQTGAADFRTFFSGSSVYHKRHDGLGAFDQIEQDPTYLGDSLHHVVVTFDGENGQLYIDRVRAYDVPQPLAINLPELLDPVHVAEACVACSVTYDEIAYYPRALDRTRIEAHYDCAIDGLCAPPERP
jgi:hypothetical protein